MAGTNFRCMDFFSKEGANADFVGGSGVRWIRGNFKCRGGRGAILPDGVGEVGTFRLRNREKGFGGFVTK